MSQIFNTLRIYKKISLLISKINYGYINMIRIKSPLLIIKIL